jgi:hypothetical protein
LRLPLPAGAGDGREHEPRIPGPLALGFDQNAGIEDQSHAGGSSGSRWLSMADSTSSAKSPSMTAVESSGKSAMHSEMVQRGGAGAWITATGNLSLFDHDFCAGTHTCQRSETWITWSGRDYTVIPAQAPDN